MGDRSPQNIYTDAKKCIWREWDEGFVNQLPNVVRVRTRSTDRNDYILHPSSGEQLSDNSRDTLLGLRPEITQSFDCLVVVSEGLNALGAMDDVQFQSLEDPGHVYGGRTRFIRSHQPGTSTNVLAELTHPPSDIAQPTSNARLSRMDGASQNNSYTKRLGRPFRLESSR